ncbi:MAG: phosphoribosylformylglycinamidine synthase subunit PurS [Gemmatimonadota bacterium]|nr:phosphoribosylformylglycinamidine synthase subunit PurS [Gemmatimonadota bacterium]MDE3013085.1 phosphoribosylformylglycinamidine synthase subunit PurS [Gemmatimonadota bacterium]
MSQYRLEVRVKPRPGLLDPQGKAIHHSLNSLGWEGVSDIRVGKAIYVDMEADSPDAALEAAEAMCRKLLANPVTEDFEVSMVGELEGAGS